MHHAAYVFDAYGTLFDVHAAVRRHAEAIGPDGQAISDLWRAKQLEYSWVRSLAGAYRDFWDLTKLALDHAFARFPSADPALKPRLLDAYWACDSFPEVPAVLRRQVQGEERSREWSFSRGSFELELHDVEGRFEVADLLGASA